ncbi:unnamed protein product [marine sediment metagenome]|uniref:Uncharacterized protein n=1 Tax=marine sediment metagenome TaxID=412755 RepID=X1PDK5_9ZZZZ
MRLNPSMTFTDIAGLRTDTGPTVRVVPVNIGRLRVKANAIEKDESRMRGIYD